MATKPTTKKVSPRPARKPTAAKPKPRPKPDVEAPQAARPYFEAVGRRKTAVARVRLYEGRGTGWTVNGRTLQLYFPDPHLRGVAEAPFRALAIASAFTVEAKVSGGGIAGQAEAVRHGISRALALWNADHRPRLKKAGFLRRDPRMKERKKYGLKGARRAPQWQKR